MPERPIYFTKPDQEELTLKNVTPGKIGCFALFSGGVSGGIAGGVSSIISGSELGLRTGVDVGVGMSGFMGGLLMLTIANERATNFAKEGRKKRAYVEALRGCVESAIGFAIAGGTAGYRVADIPGAVVGGAVGVVVGGYVFGEPVFASVSSDLKKANALENKLNT